MRTRTATIFAVLWLCSSLGAQTPDIPKGQLVERMVCQADSAQTYALYLPSSYDPTRTWPVIYAIDPGARGRVPVERFSKAAETYGYLLAGSNNAQNGPVEPALRSVVTMMNDTRQRFSIDRRRIYLTGFSGGARAASVFAQAWPGTAAAIVACGAGIAEGMEVKALLSTYFLGIVGQYDFNYLEMRRLDRLMLEQKVEHRLMVTDSRHSWPSEGNCLRAVAWLDLRAMAVGHKPKDQSLIDAVLGKETELAQVLEKQGALTDAVFAYQQIAPMARALGNAEPIEEQIRRLSGSEEFRRQTKKEEAGERRESEAEAAFQRAFSTLAVARLSDIDLGRILAEIDLPDLLKDAHKPGGSAESQMASRLLTILSLKARSMGWQYMGQSDYRRAQLFFEVGLKTTEHQPPLQSGFLFALGCAEAASGHSKKALSYLRQAVDQGFSDREAFTGEACLASLRQTPDFAEILKSLPEPTSR